jgi:hypothetical protein
MRLGALDPSVPLTPRKRRSEMPAFNRFLSLEGSAAGAGLTAL